MMQLHELKPNPGARKKARRVGRGIGSGAGKTSGRGQKGQKSRSGGAKGPAFEGGQMPLQRRLPKRGFTNIFRKEFAEVKLRDLNRFEDGAEVTPESLVEAGLVNRNSDAIKILGNGDIEKKLTVKAHRFTKSAADKIESAGGKAEVI